MEDSDSLKYALNIFVSRLCLIEASGGSGTLAGVQMVGSVSPGLEKLKPNNQGSRHINNLTS